MSDEVKIEIEKFCSELLEKKSGKQLFYTEYVKAFGRLKVLLKYTDLDITIPELKPDDISYNESIISRFINLCFIEVADAPFKSHFEEKFGNNLIYEFSDDDFNRVQKLINELREVIQASDEFEEKHRQLLLKKLDRLEAELNQKMSDLSKFPDFMSDVWIFCKKHGERAKPIYDLAMKLTDIALKVKAKAEGINLIKIDNLISFNFHDNSKQLEENRSNIE